MNIVLTVVLVGGWTLESEDDQYTLDRRKVCVEGACTSTPDVGIRADGTWVVGEFEVQWSSPTKARMRPKGGSWVPATLQSPVADASPWEGTPGARLTASWGHGVLPGFWQSATYHCEKGTTAWVFRPVVKSEPELIVRTDATGWHFGESAEIALCPGNFGGIWERERE
jgi:hypothetical protein